MLAAAVSTSTSGRAADLGGSFFDDFDRLDRGRWNVSDGWNNGDWVECGWSASNVHVDGAARLALTDEPSSDRAYSCAELQTRKVYGYGTYEAAIRTADSTSGLVTAFFTYTGPYFGDPHDEIDFEFLGKNEGTVQINYFAAGTGNHSRSIELGFDPSRSFNAYAFQWTEDALRWYVNGELVHEVLADRPGALPERPGRIYLSLWSGRDEDWLGRFAYPGQPLVAAYDYVAFTALGDDCQFRQSIVCGQVAGTESEEASTPRQPE